MSRTASLSIRVVSSPELTAALESISAGLALSTDFLERSRHLLEGGVDLVRAVTSDGDGPSASGAGDSGVLLEPTDALLELAAAARAGDFDLGIKHREAP